METNGLINTESNISNSFLPSFGRIEAYSQLIENLESEEKTNTLLNSIDYVSEDIYYNIERFKSCLKRIEKTKNYDFILNFIYFHRIIKNWKLGSCIRSIQVYLKYSENLDFESLSLEKIMVLYLNVKSKNCSEASKSIDWLKLKQMIKFTGFRYDISEFSIPEPKNQVKPEHLLTKNEFGNIITELEKHKQGKGLEYKTFLYLLADTGCRTSEIFSISKFNLVLNENDKFEVIVEGKTGERRIILYHSTKLLKKLINKGWNKWTFTYYAFYRQLNRICKKLKIQKKVYNHLLRHNFGSYIAENNSVSIEIKNKYCGWSPKSKMLETTYAHINFRLDTHDFNRERKAVPPSFK